MIRGLHGPAAFLSKQAEITLPESFSSVFLSWLYTWPAAELEITHGLIHNPHWVSTAQIDARLTQAASSTVGFWPWPATLQYTLLERSLYSLVNQLVNSQHIQSNQETAILYWWKENADLN